jgi:hypothetical protein
MTVLVRTGRPRPTPTSGILRRGGACPARLTGGPEGWP